MRISDWSSDVCSSDLLAAKIDRIGKTVAARRELFVAPFYQSHAHRSRRFERRRFGEMEARPIDGNHWAFQTAIRSEEHTSELQSLMRISYAVFCLKKKNTTKSA